MKKLFLSVLSLLSFVFLFLTCSTTATLIKPDGSQISFKKNIFSGETARDLAIAGATTPENAHLMTGSYLNEKKRVNLSSYNSTLATPATKSWGYTSKNIGEILYNGKKWLWNGQTFSSLPELEGYAEGWLAAQKQKNK